MARPALKPSDFDRRLVATLARCGVCSAHIAHELGINSKTLRKHFTDELQVEVNIRCAVYVALGRAAMRGNIRAVKLWCKLQQENSHV